MLDVGCGSGILSIIAAKLGASRVGAVDTDEEAVRVTKRTAPSTVSTGACRFTGSPFRPADGKADVMLQTS